MSTQSLVLIINNDNRIWQKLKILREIPEIGRCLAQHVFCKVFLAIVCQRQTAAYQVQHGAVVASRLGAHSPVQYSSGALPEAV